MKNLQNWSNGDTFVTIVAHMKKYKTPEPSTTIAQEAATPLYGRTQIRPLTVIETIREGLPLSKLLPVIKSMKISMSELADILHISLRTLQRYQNHKILDTDTSSKGIRLIQLYHHGIAVFEDADDFASWIRSEVAALDYNTPFSLFDTPIGFDLVDDILGRIDYGVFA